MWPSHACPAWWRMRWGRGGAGGALHVAALPGAGSWSCWRPAPGFWGGGRPGAPRRRAGRPGSQRPAGLPSGAPLRRHPGAGPPPSGGRPGAGVLRRGGAGGAAAGRPGGPSAGQSGGNRRLHPHGGGPGRGGRGGDAGRASPPCWTGGGPVRGSPGGQWRELTGGEAYLDALADALSGKLRLRWDAPHRPGVWSASPCRPRCRWCPLLYRSRRPGGGGFSAGAPHGAGGGLHGGPPGSGPALRPAGRGGGGAHHPVRRGALPWRGGPGGAVLNEGPSWPTGPRPGRTRSCWSGWRCGPAAGYPPGRGSPPPSPRAA